MKRLPFLVSRLEYAVLTPGNPNVLEVRLERGHIIDKMNLNEKGLSTDPWLEKLRRGENPAANFLKTQLKEAENGQRVQIADPGHPIRWVGSGAMLILKDNRGLEHVVINKRHELSSWPGYFDVNGGFSSSITDMLSLTSLAERELNEEVFMEKDGKKVELNLKSIIKIKNHTSVKILYRNREVTQDNLLMIIDANTGVVDFRQIFHMDIDSIERYTIRDGETRLTKKRREVPQSRKIFPIQLNKLINIYKLGLTIQEHGENINKELFTPSLSALIRSLC